MLWQIIKSKKLFYLPAQKNLKHFFPLLYRISRLFHIQIYYFIIGGWLPEFLKINKSHTEELLKLPAIFSETKMMKKNLEDWYGFKNVHLFPNFRIVDFKANNQERDNTLKLVFMSRIMKIKGTETIINFAKQLKTNNINSHLLIDFYGPTNEYEGESFEKDIADFPPLTYKGVLQPEDINTTLAKYDCMLFPTRYMGEGFPGAIVDAYISGIPVIASNIRYNAEFIDHGKTGYLYELDHEEDFYKYINRIQKDATLLMRLKKNAFAKSKEYSPEIAWGIINEIKI